MTTVTLANQMIGLVHYARIESISKNKTVTLCGSFDGSTCDDNWSKHILVFTDENADGQFDPEDNLLRNAVLFRQGESLEWRSFRNKPYLQLQPDGLTYFQNGNFTYCPADGNVRFGLFWVLNVNGHLRLGKDNNKNGVLENNRGVDINCNFQ